MQWEQITPLLPSQKPRTGRPAEDHRQVLNGMLWILRTVLTDRGSCFTAEAFSASCQRHDVQHRKTRPYMPKTNGMVERFYDRVQREVLGITLYSHRDLETMLGGFNVAYNDRRQRVLDGLSPEKVLRRPSRRRKRQGGLASRQLGRVSASTSSGSRAGSRATPTARRPAKRLGLDKSRGAISMACIQTNCAKRCMRRFSEVFY